MPLKIFLTSDVHLGMKFAGYPEVQSQLSEARFTTLENLTKRANDEKCHLFAVAGDLFDRISVAKRDVIRAAQILSEFQGSLVAVLPGNHDFISSGQSDLWTHFKENAGDNVLVLQDKKINPLHHYDLDVHLYPAPCDAKHSEKNYIDWIKEEPKDKDVKFHIGIAHGSMEGFSPDFDKKYYPMTLSELNSCVLDLWLMGHTHIQYPAKPGTLDNIFYPATPEPDGFDCTHEGRAWIIELDENSKIHPVCISTGKYRFLRDEAELTAASDMKMLSARYSSQALLNVLLKLKIKGRIPDETYKDLPRIKERMERQFLYLQLNSSEVTEEITLDTINREFTQDSFPHQLLITLVSDEDSHEALQIAYDLIREVRR